MPNYNDTYEDEDGNVWQFGQFDPYGDDEIDYYDGDDYITRPDHWSGCDTWEEYRGEK